MTAPRGHNPNEAWYFQLMADHRRGLVRHWPLVLVAFVIAIVIGVLSPDRSTPNRGQPAAATPRIP
jgi:hypothetical protein